MRQRLTALRGRSGPLALARERTEALLLGTIRVGVVLLLLTPMVVTNQTVFPWVVGKALFARSIIEVLFALWAVLALLNPAFRPPRSWLLALLGCGFVCSLIAALFGVSLVRSVWSNYERMQGLVDAVHWIALFVVLTATFRNLRHLLVVLNIHLGVGAVVALLAIASSYELPVLLNAQPKFELTRVGGLLGNALFLGGYAAVNSVLAIGMCAYSWFSGTQRDPSPRRAKRTVAVLCFGGAAYLHIHALALTETTSAWLSLAAAAFAGALWACSRHWRVLVAATAIAGLVGGGALLAAPQARSKAFEGLIALSGEKSGTQRAVALVASVAAFAERPLTGFGPENFIVAWGRHASAGGEEAHDNAHNRALEEAATKGVFGLAAYVALWVFVCLVLVRRAQAQRTDAPSHEKVLLLTMGAALTCFFVNDQLRFPTTVTNLQQMLLFALVANFEPARGGSTVAGLLHMLFGRAWMKACVGFAAMAAAAAGLYLNIVMYATASDIAKVGRPDRPGAYLERAIERFEPLANTPRVILIEQLAENWRVIRIRQSVEALRLLALVEEQAALAIAAEPANWRIHHALARLHSQVARSDPAHRPKAAHHLAISKELAPNVTPRLVRDW